MYIKKIVISDNNILNFYRKIRLYRILKFLGYQFELESSGKSTEKNEEITNIINILNTKGIRSTYNLIYDYACETLDREFICNNLCNLKMINVFLID